MKQRPPLAVMMVAVAVVLLSLSPLGYLIFRVAGSPGDELLRQLLRPRTLELLANSFLLALAVAVSATIVGTLQAWFTVRSDMPGRSGFAVLAALPLAIPSYVAAYSWLALFPQISGFFGAWLVLTLSTAPYVFLAVSSALARSSRSTEEVARSLGASPWRVARTITWPQIRPAASGAALLSALYVLSDFGAVSILRFDSFTRAIFTSYRSSFDRTGAAVLALILVLATVILLALERRVRGERLENVEQRIESRVVPLGGFRVIAMGLLTVFAGAGILLPVLSLLRFGALGASSADLTEVFGALLNSAGLALSGGLLVTVAGVFVAVASLRFSGRISSLIPFASWLMHAMPGIVVALALVFLSSNLVPALYQTTALVLFAYLVLFLPNALATISTPLAQAPRQLDEIAASLGEGSYGVLRRVVLPMAMPGVFAAAALVTLSILKELPATLLLRATGVETLTTELWAATTVGQFSAAAPYALLLVLLAGLPAWLLNRQIRRRIEGASSLERD